MKIGFTGTQDGATPLQLGRLHRHMFGPAVPSEFHHGDCIGADAEAHVLAIATGYSVVIHPPLDSAKRAFCKHYSAMELPEDYLTRNHKIVDAADVMYAVPKSSVHDLRSGTWATVRYAYKCKKPVLLFLPDGRLVRYAGQEIGKSVVHSK